MDKTRIVLIASFAMLTFMLIVEYAQFRDEKSKDLLMSQQQQSGQIADRAQTDVPQEVQTQPQSQISDEIPSQPASEDPASTIATETIPAQTQSSLVEVRTDNFIAQIDPHGGDIVHISLKQHLARIDTPDIPLVLLDDSPNRVYVAQSGLIGANGTDSAEGRPQFSTSQRRYQLRENQDRLHVDFVYQDKGHHITKRFIFKRDNYLINVEYLIDNQTDSEWQAAFYGQIRRDDSPDPSSSGVIGMAPYLGFATTTSDDRFKKISFSDVQSRPFSARVEGGWIAMLQHYYLGAWIPEQDRMNEFSTLRSRSGYNIARVTSPVTTVAPGQQGKIQAQFYAGPKNQYRLAELSDNLDLSVDYGWLWMIAQPLYALLFFFYNGTLHAFGNQWNIFPGVGNWGFSIILLTILVKMLFFSLNAKAYRSMAKMRAIQPRMLEIRERHGDDKQKQSQEMMSLYSKEGVNPLGGCLPILVQMPVFIALYWVLLESVELRHAPFIGYIKDLSAMDPYFIMPLLMGASMWFQQKLNPPPPDPMQAKIMQFLPIVFTFFFLFFPAGLVLYWVVNNLLSIAQQWVITKRIEKDTAAAGK